VNTGHRVAEPLLEPSHLAHQEGERMDQHIPVEAGSRDGVAGIGRIVAVASGKGGVGKSTVTVNLALALAGMGRTVAILDGDIYGPDVPILLGVRRRADVDERDALMPIGGGLAAAQRHQPLERHGLGVFSLAFLVGENQHLLPGNAALSGMLIRQILFDTDWGERDYLLIDLPPGTGEPQASLTSQIQLDGVVLVVTPQSTAVLDTTRSYQMFREAKTKILGLVENMSYFVCPHCGERLDMGGDNEDGRPALPTITAPVLGRLPFDPAVSRSTNSGRPVVLSEPSSVVAAVFRDIAETVDQTLYGGGGRPG
jgi:ATP-binding protein involved in chromosome partitioning